MCKFEEYLENKYRIVNLISDPIYSTIEFTSTNPNNKNEKTEKDLIDSVWLQRLRKIHQLQSTFWVFPSAENSRFVHVLGTMHLAGIFIDKIYKDLNYCFKNSLPSKNYIEELLRLSGLLHDVGHGPFGHKFDELFLNIKFKNVNHEKIGSKIIEQKLGELICNIRRSPNGYFMDDEILNPEYVSFIINKNAEFKSGYPEWLLSIRPLFCGKFFTIDNLDYVLRDSYYTGYSKDPINLNRIIYYTSLGKNGIIFASPGKNSLKQFIRAKIDLYNSVYFHRTVRAIDLAIDSIFFQTMEKFCNFNPMESLDNYPGITEYDLFYIVNKWFQSDDYNEKYLGQEWNKILSRKKEWFVAFEDEFRIGSSKKEEMIGWQFINDIEHCKILEKKIYDKLELYLGKEKTKNIVIAINTASHDPSYPAIDESMQIYDYNSCKIENRMLQDWIDDIPSKVIIFRVYTKNQEYIKKISEVSKEVLFKITPSISTNY